MPQMTVAVIGAGFSGTLLSLWLHASAPSGARICLIDRERFAVGRAYATSNRNHLLNVPAGRMSALPDHPGDFVRWLQEQPKARPSDLAVSEAAFVPRVLYGAYLQDLLYAAMRRSHSAGLDLLEDAAIWVEERLDGVAIGLASGATLCADVGVLAIGNPPPLPVHPDTDRLDAAGLWRGNPWDYATFASLDPRAPVLLIGTGLTMVDAVISLLDAGHTGPIRALSRHGFLPRRHAASQAAPAVLPAPPPNELRPLMRIVRREIERALEAGTDWRPVIDALRPSTQDMWQGLSERERGQFLRHLRTWWDVHRHRMAPAAADRIEAALASGQLCLHAGRIVSLDVRGGMASVIFRRRGTGTVAAVSAARVINCTGPATDVTCSTEPLMQALLRTGLARPDPHRLGLDVSASGALINRDGQPSGRLFAVGPLTKGARWEITSVPDIRTQCRDMANSLGLLLARRATGDGGSAPMPFRALPMRSPEFAGRGN